MTVCKMTVFVFSSLASCIQAGDAFGTPEQKFQALMTTVGRMTRIQKRYHLADPAIQGLSFPVPHQYDKSSICTAMLPVYDRSKPVQRLSECIYQYFGRHRSACGGCRSIGVIRMEALLSNDSWEFIHSHIPGLDFLIL